MSDPAHAPFDAPQYERLSTGTVPGYAALQELVALAAAAMTPRSPAAVLDLGCGAGAGLVALSRALPGAQLTGCDPVPSMVAAARMRCEAAAPDELSAALRSAGFASITPLCQLLAVHGWLAHT